MGKKCQELATYAFIINIIPNLTSLQLWCGCYIIFKVTCKAVEALFFSKTRNFDNPFIDFNESTGLPFPISSCEVTIIPDVDETTCSKCFTFYDLDESPNEMLWVDFCNNSTFNFFS